MTNQLKATTWEDKGTTLQKYVLTIKIETKIWTLKQIAVIILKFEHCGFTRE